MDQCEKYFHVEIKSLFSYWGELADLVYPKYMNVQKYPHNFYKKLVYILNDIN